MNFEKFKAEYQKAPVEHYPHSVTNSPLVSVCVLAYQHSGYIRQCLDGILMQQANFDFEILLGEDASTDGTREICVEFAKKYPEKIKLLLHHRENVIRISDHPTGRFNLLYSLLSAKGKYLAICDGDDYWTDPLKLTKQVDCLERNPAYVAVFHDTEVITSKGMRSSHINYLYPDFRVESRSISLNDLLIHDWIIPTCSSMIRYSRLSIPEGFARMPNGDYPLFISLAAQGDFYLLKDNMGCYRRNNPHSVTLVRDGVDLIFNRSERIAYISNLFKAGIIKDESLYYRLMERNLIRLIKNSLRMLWRNRKKSFGQLFRKTSPGKSSLVQ